MSKFIKSVVFSGLFVAFLGLMPGKTLAYYPTLSVAYNSNGNYQISVNGVASYSQISLYYRQNSSIWTNISNVGMADASGNFSQVVSIPSDGTSNVIYVYVTAGGDQSSTVSIYPGSYSYYNYNYNYNGGYTGCSLYGCYGNYGSVTLSPSSLSMSVGQTSTVTAYVTNYSSSGIYVSNNSNSSVVSASVSGSTISVYAKQSGSATLTVCSSSNSNVCATLYVTVTGYSYGNVYFSPSTLSLSAGQSSTVSIYNSGSYYSGSYYVSSNSNSSVASASLSGGSLYVSASSAGNTTITVCQSGYSSSCGSLYVSVSGSVLGASTNVWFSPSSPYMSVGQSLSVSLSSGSYYYGSYYVSSNSNSSVVSASVSGSTLNLYAYQNGSSSITVCNSTSGYCGTLYVSVGGGSNYYNYGNLSLSQTSLSMSINQTSTVTVSGSGSYYYISSNSSPSVVNASISGNTLTVYAKQAGSTTLSVCQSGYSNCISVYVTVSNYYYGYNNNYNYNYSSSSYNSWSNGSVLGASTYANGQLISENGTVYIVYRNTKTGFASASVFTSLGFKFSNVSSVGSSGLSDSGYVVRNAYSSHPWGTWVKSGSTIYFVHESGLIPVPDYATFLNNGGRDAYVVSANSADFSLPVLSVMTYNDSRLQ